MRSTLSKILIALTLSGWLQLAAASEANCTTSEVSPIKLRVTVSPGQRQDFIKFLQSDREPFALGARYVGGAEVSDVLSMVFLEILDSDRASTVTIEADNKKPSPVFVFSFESCNTTRRVAPYRDAARKRISEFGFVSVVEVVSK